MTSTIGIDCASDCTKFAAAIATSDAKVVGRYYRWPTSKYKPLTHTEAVSLSAAGLKLLALWEWTSAAIENFTLHNGIDQGTSAINQALQTHQPPGTPIYFAVDFDASASQISGAIADYFKGVHQALSTMNAGYKIGVYGSGRTCAWLTAHGGVSHSWLAYAPKWGGSETFKAWNVQQGHDDLKIAGLTHGSKGNYDSNIVRDDAGLFTVFS